MYLRMAWREEPPRSWTTHVQLPVVKWQLVNNIMPDELEGQSLDAYLRRHPKIITLETSSSKNWNTPFGPFGVWISIKNSEHAPFAVAYVYPLDGISISVRNLKYYIASSNPNLGITPKINKNLAIARQPGAYLEIWIRGAWRGGLVSSPPPSELHKH